jgi:hypothetical protein
VASLAWLFRDPWRNLSILPSDYRRVVGCLLIGWAGPHYQHERDQQRAKSAKHVTGVSDAIDISMSAWI